MTQKHGTGHIPDLNWSAETIETCELQSQDVFGANVCVIARQGQEERVKSKKLSSTLGLSLTIYITSRRTIKPKHNSLIIPYNLYTESQNVIPNYTLKKPWPNDLLGIAML